MDIFQPVAGGQRLRNAVFRLLFPQYSFSCSVLSVWVFHCSDVCLWDFLVTTHLFSISSARTESMVSLLASIVPAPRHGYYSIHGNKQNEWCMSSPTNSTGCELEQINYICDSS